MRRLWTVGSLALVLVLAGCLGNAPFGDEEAEAANVTDPVEDVTGHLMNFSQPLIIDETRAGGEPVIAITQEGTILVSAHPGWTHYHPSEDPTNPGSELLTPANGQSYLWRSTDNGSTWQHIGTPGADGQGPRGAGFGVSDPDFTVDDDGRIYRTDLEALAAASVDWSDDDGETWVFGNPIASHGAVDRQWVASHEGTVYFTANYLSPPGRHVMASEDGIVWEQRGQIPGPCGGDFVAAPQDGTLYAGCGGSIAVSTDEGATWEQRTVPGHEDEYARMTEPAVDSAGNVWTAWETNESQLYLAGSPDKGESWPWVHELSGQIQHALNGTSEHTLVWPWVSAGSEGRVAVSVYATPTPPPSDAGPLDRAWSVVTVAVMDADTDQAPAAHGYVLAEGNHVGPICQSGTACQVNSLQGSPNSDRRLGDFFETTIGPDGHLYAAYSDTADQSGDVVSHPGFVKQTGGPNFIADGVDYVPTQG